MKRLLSAFLSVAMILSLVPTPALAEAVRELEAAQSAANQRTMALEDLSPAQGAAPQGASAQGSTTQGAAPQGASAQEAVPQGATTQGAANATSAENTTKDPGDDGSEEAAHNQIEPEGDAAANMPASPIAVQALASGTHTDPTNGVKYYLDLVDGGEVAITGAEIPEGEGSLDLTLISGHVTFDPTGGGDQMEISGEITSIAGNFYGWGGTSEARARVRSVTIPNTITRIDGKMFRYGGNELTNLQSVTFEPAGSDADHAGVTTLPEGMFLGGKVASVTLPSNLSTISKEMFYGCSNLTSITLPASMRSIGDWAFGNCQALTSVTFNEGLETLGSNVFNHRDTSVHAQLTEVALPNSLTSIGDHAFFDMDTLASVNFGTSLAESQLSSIGDCAFEGCALAEVNIPDSVTEIGGWAFANCRERNADEGDRYTIQTVRLGSSQETSQLQRLGSRAFFRSRIATIALPNKLVSLGYDPDAYQQNNHWYDHTDEHGDCTGSAFYGSPELTSIVWPTRPPENGLGLTHIGGFDNCPKLSPSVVGNLPWWITAIDQFGFGQSFVSSNETDLTIPSTVTHIGEKAFSSTCRPSWSNPQISCITIKDGAEPLSVDYRAFENAIVPGATIRLPERLASAGDEAFCVKGTYYLYNPNVSIAEGTYPWGDTDSTVCYPEDAAEGSGVVAHKAACEANGRRTRFLSFAVHPARSVTGTVPEGATVRLVVNGVDSNEYQLAGTAFTATLPDESIVAVVVSLEGYASYTLHPGENGVLTSDWHFEVAADDMTPLYTTGNLAVIVKKNTKAADPNDRPNIEAAVGCNVAVFDSAGKLAASGKTPTSRTFVAQELPAGTYTVIAFDKNERFSFISSVDDLSLMGAHAGSWAQQSIDVSAGETTTLELLAPDFQIDGAEEILDSGEVSIAKAKLVPECPVFARVRYQMKDNKPATAVTVSIPEGLEPTSVATLGHSYGTGGYDAQTRTLTIEPVLDDQQSATVSVGLKAHAPDTYVVGASVSSGASTAPLGSASLTASALELDLPTDDLPTPTFTADVYATPGSVVYFKINGVQVADEEGSPVSCVTNRIGHATASLTIPEDEIGSLSLYSVTAYTTTGDDCTDPVAAEQTKAVEYFVEDPANTSLREWELSFVHGGTRNYIVRDGEEIPNAHYTCYSFANHIHHPYSPTWPFTSVFKSKRELGDSATLMLKSMTGVLRYEEMTLLQKEEETDATGQKTGYTTYTYMTSVAIGDGNPEHDLEAKDIPVRFEVIPQQVGYEQEFVPPTLTQKNVDTIKATFQTPEEYLASQRALFNISYDHTSFWSRVNTQGLPEDELDAIVEDMDLLDIIINEKYKHENWQRSWNVEDKRDIDVYDTLTDAQKAKVKEFEDAIDESLLGLQQMLGDNKPLNEYNSIDEYLSDNYGYHQLDASAVPDPEELRAQGYQIIYDDNAAEGEPTWYAMRLRDENGETVPNTPESAGLASQEDPQDKERDPFDIRGYVADCYNSAGEWWHKTFSYANREELSTFWLPQSISLLSSTIGDLGKYIAAFMANNWSKEFLAKWGANATWAADFLGAIGIFFAARYAYGMQPKLDRLANERNRLIKEFLSLYMQLATMGQSTSRCRQAMAVEMLSLMNYGTATAVREYVFKNWDVRNNLIFAIMGVMSGPVGKVTKVTKLTGLKIFGAGLGWSKFVSWLQTSYIYPWAKSSGAQWMKDHMERLRQCAGDTNPKHKDEPIQDPSGFVYEAVVGNPVEGAAATVQYSTDGGLTWLDWIDAPSYEQVTTQLTDATGSFGWDVPQGLWRVSVVKDGYQSFQTAGLEVPPPRTGLAIPLITRLAPTVESVTADDEYLEVIFKQHMSLESEPAVTMGESVLEGGAWADQTPASGDDGAASYARVWRVPVPHGTLLGYTQPVTVANATNYAGIPMATEWSGNVKTAPRPAQIELDYGDVVTQAVGTTRSLNVRVLDKGGDPIQGATVVATGNNAPLANVSGADVATDADGATSAQVEALLPGTSALTFSVAGTSLSRTVTLATALNAPTAARPTAAFGEVSVAEGDTPLTSYYVDAGTEVTLGTSTQDAKVYYTTDGSDPRVAGASRQTYRSPIAITADTRIRAVSYADGFDFGDELSLEFVVRRNLEQATISAIQQQPYTGEARTPKPTVTLEGRTLKEGADYTLSYKNNVVPGTATVIVKAKADGRYSGTTSATFKIKRVRDFPDVAAGAWYEDVVYRAVGLGLLNGYEDGKFGPNDKITRGQVAVILWNMAGGPSAGTGAKTFPDVHNEDYFYRAVRWASSVGVVSGYDNGSFGPKDNVTREQLAVMLANYSTRVARRPATGSVADFASMKDRDKVSGWAVSAVGWCFKSGIVSGTGDGRVDPQGTATRAEAAKMVVFFHDMLT